MKKITCILAVALFIVAAETIHAQVAINNSSATPDASAILDLNSGNTGVNKGFLPPQVALNATNVAAPVTGPATGLIVYNTATAGTVPYNVTPGYYYWNGSQWLYIIAVLPGSAGQVLTSNGGGAPSWATIAPVQTNVKDSAWLLTGNYGTTVGTNFIGTDDNNDLEFRINNKFSGLIDSSFNNTFFGYTSGKLNTTGTQNTAMGYMALAKNIAGYENTAIGNVALQENTSGYENTGVGEHALNANTTGYDNVAMGDDCLNLNTTGYFNTAIGEAAMFYCTGGESNTALGYQSLNSITTGALNTGVGAWALSSTTNSLTDNTAIGYNAMNSATGGANTGCGESALWDVFGDYNVALGYQAAYDHVGYYNVAIGATSLNNVSGQYNSVLGYASTVNPGTLDNATAIGANSLATSSNSVVLGSTAVTQTQFNGALMPNYSGNYQAGATGQVLTSHGVGLAPQWVTPISVQTNVKDSAWLLTGNSGTNRNTNFIGTTDYNDLVFKVANLFSGIIDIQQDNTFFGIYAGNNSMSSYGSYNAAFGYYALQANTTGSENTALGMNALASNTSANGNTAIGEGALSYDTTGFVNTATGNNALALNTNGSWNTASGAAALGSNTTGSNNTAAGDEALYSNTIGNENASFGDHALQINTTGSFNTATGSRSLYHNLTGCSNNAYGYNSLNKNTTGSADVAIGDSALFNNINGSYNSALGYNANVSLDSLTNATAIGANSLATSSNSIVLGSRAVTQTQFNGALMPNYSGNYQSGTSGQVLTSQGAGVAPQWATPSNGSLTYATGAQTFVNNSDPQSNTTQGYSCTTILTSVPSATISLSVSGTYLIMANADCGSYAASSGSAVGIALTDGTNYWGSNQVVNPGDGSSTFNWVPWSTTTVVTIASSTTYNIQANSPSSGTGYVRNARVTAIKLQ